MLDDSASVRSPLFQLDLLHCILDCLPITLPECPENAENRATLAALARTCRTLSGPLLDRLWRRLDSLLPLIWCLASVVDETRLKTPPSPLEWLIINKYSPRIQELALGKENYSLYLLQNTNFVLPNLRSFRWETPARIDRRRQFQVNSVATFWPLFSPNIDALVVELSGTDGSRCKQFLENLPNLPPNLTSIKLDFRSANRLPSITNYLSQAIRSQTDWRHVKLSPAIDSAAFKHLAMSSKLEKTSLTLAPMIMQPDEILFTPGDTPFRNATKVSLMLWGCLDFATNLLRDHGQVFQKFGVNVSSAILTTEISAFLTAIASPQRVESLESLAVKQDPTRDTSIPPSETRTLSYEILRPLASFTRLRKLVIDLNNEISLNDGEFSSLVSNWPRLEALRLTGMNGGQLTRITLRGLSSLLVSCQYLREIAMSVDARDVPDETRSDACRPSVTRLLFQDSPLADVQLVADFIFRYLPRATMHTQYSRKLFEGDDWTYECLWLQVREANRRRATRDVL